MIEKAVIDRFEGDIAVMLVGKASRQVDIPRSQLPEGVKAGDWLKVEWEEGRLLHAELDASETARRKKRIAAKLERLRRGAHLKKKS